MESAHVSACGLETMGIVPILQFLAWGAGAETNRMLLVASSPFGFLTVTA
jgi:hypothetical protein